MRTTVRRRLITGLLASLAVLALPVPDASADSTEYLVDREAATEGVSVTTGEAVVGGTTYAKSVLIGLYLEDQGGSEDTTYDVGGVCGRLTGVLGVPDTVEPRFRLRLQVFADGRLAQEAVLAAGSSVPLDADLSGASVLRLVGTVDTDAPQTVKNVPYAAFADPVLRCTGIRPGRTTVTASATSVAPGGALTVSGVLTDTGGSPVAGQTVAVQSRQVGDQGFETVATCQSDAAGRWSAVVRPEFSARYRASVAGTRTRPEVLGDTEPAVEVRSTLSINAQRLGTRSYRFYGTLRPGRDGRQVSLFRRTGTKETLVSRTTTDERGVYDVRRTFTGSGRFDFLVRFTADGYSTSATSAVRPTSVY